MSAGSVIVLLLVIAACAAGVVYSLRNRGGCGCSKGEASACAGCSSCSAASSGTLFDNSSSRSKATCPHCAAAEKSLKDIDDKR